MSSTIKQAIEALKSRVADAYTAIVAKGGKLPATQDSASLPSAIASIPSGGMEYDGFYPADGVKLSSMFQGKRIVRIDNSSITKLWQYFSMADSLTLESVRFSNLTNIDGTTAAFIRCKKLTAVDMPKLTVISNFFDSCGELVDVNLPLLTTIYTTGTFYGCGSLKNLSFPSLTRLEGSQQFSRCRQLRVLSMPLLNYTTSNLTYSYCTSLIDIITGQNFSTNMNFSTWSPTIALLDTESSLVEEGEPFANNLEKFLYNIREHIAANLPDRTGLSSLTITFSAAVKSAINADAPTADAFTNKNWVIA